MIENILVPLDGSEHSEKALDFAAAIAVKFDAGLHLLQVIEHTEVPKALLRFAEAEHLPGPPTYIHETVAKGILEGGMARAKEAGIAKVESTLERGDAAQTILEQAQKLGVDLIVLGSRGLGNVEGLLLGSVSHKVGQMAPCPCTTVR